MDGVIGVLFLQCLWSIPWCVMVLSWCVVVVIVICSMVWILCMVVHVYSVWCGWYMCIGISGVEFHVPWCELGGS